MASNDINHHMDECTLEDVGGICRMLFSDPLGRRIVLMLYGSAGIGKTSVVEQVAAELGMKVVRFNASMHGKEDLTGFPLITTPKDPHMALGGKIPIGWTSFMPPLSILNLTVEFHDQQRKLFNAETASLLKVAHKAEEAGRLDDAAEYRRKAAVRGEYPEPEPTILFLDEFVNAPKDVQPAYHALVLDGKIGQFHLLPNVQIMAAGNRRSDGAVVCDLSPPLQTRMTHLQVVADLSKWLAHARREAMYPPLIAFVRGNKGLFNMSKEAVADRGAVTAAVPRTWASASARCITFIEKKGLKVKSNVVSQMLMGCLGDTAAEPFLNFLAKVEAAPSVEKIIADPESVSAFKDNPDMAMVVTENIIAKLRTLYSKKTSAKSAKKILDAIITYSKGMEKSNRDVLLDAMQDMPGYVKVADREKAPTLEQVAAAICQQVASGVTDGEEPELDGAGELEEAGAIAPAARAVRRSKKTI